MQSIHLHRPNFDSLLTVYDPNLKYLHFIDDKEVEEKSRFIWFQLFEELIIKLEESSSSKIEQFRHVTNTTQLEQIDKFEQNYRSADAIEWHLRADSVYKLINNALRI